MLHFLEVEELVGRYWHRWASRATSYPRHPQAAVSLDSVRNALGVFFRCTGGEAGLEVATIVARNSRHRLSIRQRLGFDEEPVDQARRDDENLLLPPVLDYFPEAAHNRMLYFWLAAFLAEAQHPSLPENATALQTDVALLREVRRASERVCENFPGLAANYHELCLRLLAMRPARKLPPLEQALEHCIQALLGGGPEMRDGYTEALWQAINDPAHPLLSLPRPGRDYRPPLPVPLWGEIHRLGSSGPKSGQDGSENDHSDSSSAAQGKRRSQRRRQDQTERDDPRVLNRFEKMLSWAEMVNVNRLVEDNEDEEAKRAA